MKISLLFWSRKSEE